MKTNLVQNIFLGVLLLIILVVMLALTGCKHLANYRRSYTLAAVDQFGQRVEVGVTLEPREVERLEVVRQLEREGVIAKAPVVIEDEGAEVLQPAAMQLEILKGAGQTGGLTPAVGRDVQPPSSAVAMVWLAKDGALRVESHPEVIAMYRAAGWVDMPPPGFEDGEAPQWDAGRGRWRVKRVKPVSGRTVNGRTVATSDAGGAR